jgi:hypothetical protein
LSTATWQQVLLLFMTAGFGWCWFSIFSRPNCGRSPTPYSVPDQSGLSSQQRPALSGQGVQASVDKNTPARARRQPRLAASARETKSVSAADRVQKVYRFPMHQLSRQTLMPAVDYE